MESTKSNVGYEEYYLRNNPPTARNYEKKGRGYHRRFGRILDEAKAQSVLDIGCATGMLTRYLVGRGYRRVVGIDLNAKLIEVARQNVQTEFVADDAVHFAATCKEKFDIIFLLDILEHLERPQVEELLRHVRGLLNDGGFALVRTPNMNCLHSSGSFNYDWTHITPFTEGSLFHVATLAGFGRVEHCNQFRMQNFKAKIKACINALIVPTLIWLRGGKKAKVFYYCLVAKLHA
jgi:2-polyprenyl-3-methyl-5-hydroxy-6-metoxy-1,4-benzoquinol methylase